MKNKALVLFLALVVSFVGTSYAFAQGYGERVQIQQQTETQVMYGEGGSGSESTGTQTETNQGIEVKATNEIKSENEIKTTSSEEGTSTEQEVDKAEPVRMAEQVRSEVSSAVQEMLKVADRSGGIGEEIRVIAQSQNDNQKEIADSIKNIEGRSGFVRFLIGPNYNEVDNAQKALDQNKEQITKLNEIHASITNKTDQQVLANQISVLEKANLDIEATLNKSQSGFSLLGWLFKLVK